MNKPFEIDILIEVKRKKEEIFTSEKRQKTDFRVKINESNPKKQKIR